jgi:glutamine amidotransferase
MNAVNVAIVDGGGANLASLQFALDRLGAESLVTADRERILQASHVILPGVGAAAAAMKLLKAKDLVSVLPQVTRPFLGICLGMQLLCDKSAEDDADCLRIIPGQAMKLLAGPDYPVPNMGWSEVTRVADSALFAGIDDRSWFYFVHSYALPVNKWTSATAEHRGAFSAAVSRRNFHGVQFHPERSSTAGARLLQNFLELD